MFVNEAVFICCKRFIKIVKCLQFIWLWFPWVDLDSLLYCDKQRKLSKESNEHLTACFGDRYSSFTPSTLYNAIKMGMGYEKNNMVEC